MRDGIERDGMSNLKFMELFEKVYLSGTEQEMRAKSDLSSPSSEVFIDFNASMSCWQNI